MRIVSDQNWIAALPDHARHELLQAMKIMNFERGDVITQPGERARRIHQLRTGYAKVYVDTPDGSQAILVLYRPGNCFSETAVISDRCNNHVTVAATSCAVAAIDRDTFMRLYEKHPEIPDLLCRKFSNVITSMLSFRVTVAASPIRNQIGVLFNNLLTYCSEGTEGSARRITAPITIKEISAILGVSRQTIHKEIQYFRDSGILERDNDEWLILSPQSLQAVAVAID
ncbi:Crp/Fnr family transcriptional regulator [Hyphomonas sp. CY54-11-8]|uniref:Crp/Fnr family transcriptional regulator n=1 Tax=Hyphomonas sp. CY54-11-8 TaxID=1280944 RepID=UPI000458FDEF|nr:Crp/Fnr family transcriptional regulator [Hyphomonas sp. CY54-11-8]KCZ48119.1 hypothetical protein HY17_17670 [Hyphomonas sp. CY54-11-8]MDY0041331.1 Crp/Fnr family transcriptional regulator [Desulforhabdus sp.]